MNLTIKNTKAAVVQNLTMLFILTLLPFTLSAELVLEDDVDDMRRINFNSIPTLSAADGPLQIGAVVGLDVTLRASLLGVIYTNYDGFGLAGNGSWGQGMTYVGIDTANNELFIDFNFGNVSQVVMFMNYSDAVPALVITAYDDNMQVLETYDVHDLAPISTPSALNEGAFRGIQRSQADIATIGITGYYPVIDKLTFSTYVSPPL